MRPVTRPAAIAAVILLLGLPASAGAFPLTNCTLDLTSTDSSGAPLDSATGNGAGGTMEDPFLVD